MMDRLDHLLDAASPLLDRVDRVLSTVGAPEGHPVWTELRRVRLLPGDAARAVGALYPEAIRDAVPELRANARAYASVADALPLAGAWEGEAADAYERARRRTAEHLNGGPDSLGRRMEATADFADALTSWMARSRGDLAAMLAAALVSAEAVTLTTETLPPDEEARLAAAVATPLLRTVADSYDRGETLLNHSVSLQN
ncbi:uncharacterized protein YukE [Actinoplanes lutulentus]|uniref:Uncharacterized protein n=1 Tax=Actinoplanes lutulentus TaxID=1287878 RepID=A0A327ZAU9_9ACTN|nr:hypothetical protein [Actinoplanes lutulentus]MBB2945095.1 uncharacterized protein YukE [Actinoplanes lutulentus]RAK31891.1 hypothetical protein B0I29_114140 [Actinoplanes lutulentus]